VIGCVNTAILLAVLPTALAVLAVQSRGRDRLTIRHDCALQNQTLLHATL
jgi:hypothetical protein